MAENADKPKRTSALHRFAPLAVIVAGLVFAYAMGWQRFFSLTFLADSREMLQGFVSENYALSLAGFAAAYALAVAFSLPAASVLTIFSRLPVRLARRRHCRRVSPRPRARPSSSWSPAAPSAMCCATRSRRACRRLAEGFEKDAFTYLLFLRLAPMFPFFVMNIAPALLQRAAAHLCGRHLHRHHSRHLRLCLARARASTAFSSPRPAAGHEVSVADLVTRADHARLRSAPRRHRRKFAPVAERGFRYGRPLRIRASLQAPHTIGESSHDRNASHPISASSAPAPAA